MTRTPLRRSVAGLAAVALVSGGLALAGPAQAAPAAASDPALARSPELSETSRLADRRTVVTGTEGWVLGSADGRFPAAGFHTRGEMGGFWTPSLKLLDGVWFGIGASWIGPGTRTTTGWGYVRTDLPATDGVAASRTDLVPDGVPGALVGLTLQSSTTRTVVLRADAHSELMGSYPWGESTPSQTDVNLADTGAVDGTALVFRDRGTPPGPNQTAHDWAAAFGSAVAPTTTALGRNFRGPQDPVVVCPASGPDAPTQPARCDDTAYGKGTGGQLAYKLALTKDQPVTVWFGVGGSRSGPDGAKAALSRLLADPDAALAAKVRKREKVASSTVVSLPGDPLMESSVAWSKQMLAASVQRSDDVALRVVDAGKAYPAPVATLDSMRWIGAGWPDYTWLFGTDGEFTAFASVAAGQFGPIKAHLRTLRDVSEAVNGGSGKIVHEVTPDGAVYFGANADEGNTDESAKYPSAVALVWRWTGDKKFLRDLYPASVRAMRHVASLDTDGDGWPGGLGNVERSGMGSEKLDNAVYTIRGYADLADLAKARGDQKTERWATGQVTRLSKKFEKAWWYGKDGARSYADSLDPGDEGGANTKIFQRHWIGLTPTDAVLPAVKGRKAGPLASDGHARTTLAQHERSCYTGELGLFHTGTGATTDPTGNEGATCDSVVSAVPSERDIFTLNSAIAGVSEGNYGRLAADQQGVYTHGNAKAQLDPALWEMPGMMPEIVPSPRSGANIDRLYTERSMVMQAWGAYGTLWPVVHQWLGVSPDMGRGRLAVVPQLPPDQDRASVGRLKVGAGRIDVTARRTEDGSTTRYATTVTRHGRATLVVGAVVPKGSKVRTATLNGAKVRTVLTPTSRGLEVTARAKGTKGTARFVVTVR
ncbi:glucosidase family protein [Microlunatus flavus]|uniref:Glycogen debranching protein n=1 Tax=Microlunatus flavus TaxID=1036181 RepID=A0A1H9FBC5_9ACTN|nr:glycogen debranching protein [Microlunatus flavus]SEQ35230.1 hypothetical protein SAMN05421756_103218 [Microlunatus flavus]